MAKQDTYTRYTVRIPDDLYQRIKEAAGDASVNSEIVAALIEKFPPPVEPINDGDILAIFNREVEKLEKKNPKKGSFKAHYLEELIRFRNRIARDRLDEEDDTP